MKKTLQGAGRILVGLGLILLIYGQVNHYRYQWSSKRVNFDHEINEKTITTRSWVGDEFHIEIKSATADAIVDFTYINIEEDKTTSPIVLSHCDVDLSNNQGCYYMIELDLFKKYTFILPSFNSNTKDIQFILRPSPERGQNAYTFRVLTAALCFILMLIGLILTLPWLMSKEHRM